MSNDHDDVTPIDRWPARAPRSPAPPHAAARADLSDPGDLLDSDPDPEVRAVVERSPRNARDPATYEDIVKLAVALTRERSGNRQRALDMQEVLREPHRAAKSSRRHMYAAIAFAAMSLAGAIRQWSDRTAVNGADAVHIQLQRLEHDVDRLDTELRELRQLCGRRSELLPQSSAGAMPALTVPSKGIVP